MARWLDGPKNNPLLHIPSGAEGGVRGVGIDASAGHVGTTPSLASPGGRGRQSWSLANTTPFETLPSSVSTPCARAGVIRRAIRSSDVRVSPARVHGRQKSRCDPAARGYNIDRGELSRTRHGRGMGTWSARLAAGRFDAHAVLHAAARQSRRLPGKALELRRDVIRSALGPCHSRSSSQRSREGTPAKRRGRRRDHRPPDAR